MVIYKDVLNFIIDRLTNVWITTSPMERIRILSPERFRGEHGVDMTLLFPRVLVEDVLWGEHVHKAVF